MASRLLGATLASVLAMQIGFAQVSPAVDTAPAPRATDESPDQEATHDELRKLRTVMQAALNAGDIDTIVANVDEQVVFTTMNGDVVRGKDGIRQYYTKMMTGPGRVVEKVTTDFLADDLSILHGSDIAIAFGSSNDSYVLANGSRFSMANRWSATMLRRDDRWLIASFHYSANVFDNPILDTQRRWLVTGAAGAAVAAFVIGLLVGRRRIRRAP